MAAADDSSELSSLSSLSPAPSDDEIEKSLATGPKSKKGILSYFPKVSELPPKEPSPPPRKRSPSPPHEYVLADNADIAVCFPIIIIVSDYLFSWHSLVCLFHSTGWFFLGVGGGNQGAVRAAAPVSRVRVLTS